MLASAAFLLGLTLALAGDAGTLVRRFAFQQAHHRARGRAGPPAPPAAREGLVGAGVLAEEADELLAVIEARAACGQTGAAGQGQALAALEPKLDRSRALAAMLERYLELQRAGDPVHTWPLA